MSGGDPTSEERFSTPVETSPGIVLAQRRWRPVFEKNHLWKHSTEVHVVKRFFGGVWIEKNGLIRKESHDVSQILELFGVSKARAFPGKSGAQLATKFRPLPVSARKSR